MTQISPFPEVMNGQLTLTRQTSWTYFLHLRIQSKYKENVKQGSFNSKCQERDQFCSQGSSHVFDEEMEIFVLDVDVIDNSFPNCWSSWRCGSRRRLRSIERQGNISIGIRFKTAA